MKCAGLIAAAGKSSRMGSPKALLKIGEKTAVELLINTFAKAGISPIVVTIPEPPHRELVEPVLRRYAILSTANQFYDLGLIGSVRSCLSRLANDVDLLVVCPVDCPFISAELIQTLLQHAHAEGVFVPTYKGIWGHPIAIGKAHFGKLWSAESDSGMQMLFAREPGLVCEIPWYDELILQNINSLPEPQ